MPVGAAILVSVMCTGKIFLPNATVLDVVGTLETTRERAPWLHTRLEAKAGKLVFQFDQFTTYDATTKKWRRVMIDNTGGYMTGWSADGNDFALEGVGPMGTLLFRDHAVAGGSWGERSVDRGKTWVRDYELSCKK